MNLRRVRLRLRRGAIRPGLAIRMMGCAVAATTLCGLAACTPVIYSTAESTAQTVKGFIPSGDLQTHAVPSIKQVKVETIAVMPVIASPGDNGDVVADGGPHGGTAE